MKYWLSISFLAIFLLIGCGENTYFEHAFEDEDGVWSYTEIRQTSFDILDSTQRFDLVLDIDHNPDFEFQNIYFKIKTTFPNGKSTEQQLPINLADKRGKWFGKCNSNSCNVRVLLQKQAYFKNLGKHHISFEQYSREQNLKGINGMEFKII